MSAQLYRHFDAKGVLLYVGVAQYIGARNGAHASQSPWFKDVAATKTQDFESRYEALQAERKAILEEHPLHNRQGTKKSINESRVQRYIGVEVPPETKAALIRKAEKQRRSLSNFVCRILEREAREDYS